MGRFFSPKYSLQTIKIQTDGTMTEKKKAPQPDSPYLSARREWNERYGSFIKKANDWRIIALGSVAVSLVAVGGLVWVAGQQKVIPYAVEFDNNGEVTRVARLSAANTPTDRQMIAGLRNWIIGARAIYSDPYAQKAIIDQTYAMTYPDSACYQTIATYHRDNNPYLRASKETVHLDVHSILPISGSTWQLEWTEITKQPSGKVISSKQYQGSISTIFAPPTDEKQIMINPLGIYAQQCSWTTRIQANNY